MSQAHKESDPRLPRGPAPVQAYISAFEGKLIMRTRGIVYQPTTKLDTLGLPTTSYMPIETETKNFVDIPDLKMVLEVQRSGQRFLDLKEMGKAIKGETLALVVVDNGDFDLAHLRLIREGTLVFVLAHKAFAVPPIPKAPIAAQAVPVELLPVLPAAPAAVAPPLLPLPIQPIEGNPNPLPAAIAPPPLPQTNPPIDDDANRPDSTTESEVAAHYYRKRADIMHQKMQAVADARENAKFEKARLEWLQKAAQEYDRLAEELQHKARQITLTPKENDRLRNAEFAGADLRFEMDDVPQALRRYGDFQDKYRRQAAGLIACQKIRQCVTLMHDYPAQARMARADMVEALRKFKADLEAMPEESDAFRGPGVYRKKDWEKWLQTVTSQLNPPTPPPLLPPPYPPPPVSHSQFNAQTIQQANRDLAALKFYAKTGHRVSAAFYRDLIERRYPDSLYSRQAAQLVREMIQPVPPPKATSFIGRIIIVGNEYLPEGIIRNGLGFYPGQPFNGNALPVAMKGLHFEDIGIKLSLTVEILNTPGDYKDIQVYVHEELSEATRTDINKLQGTWTVVSTSSFPGTAVPASITEVTFQGNEMTSKGKIADRGFFLLDPARKPKQIRLIPFDGPADARTSTASYKFKDALLVLRLPIDAAIGNPNGLVVELTLKRKQPPGAPPPAPAPPQAHSEVLFSVPYADSPLKVATRILYETRVPTLSPGRDGR